MNFKQSICIINFEHHISTEEREEIVSKFYLDNEKAIIGMNTIHMKENINCDDGILKVCEETK